MEYELQNERYWKQHQKKDENPDVRFYYTLKRQIIDEVFLEEEEKTKWELSGGEGMKRWSAVGYYFADRFSRETDITVGIIGCNWGATSASCWIGTEDLRADSLLREYVDEYEAGLEGKSEEVQTKEYAEFEKYHMEWEAKAAECYTENPLISWEEVQKKCGICKWPGPLNCRSPFRPGGLYETMIKRIAPYTMRGVLWYQGENDTNKPNLYETLLSKLIEVWRREFQNDGLAFYIVQLAMHRYLPDEDTMNWPVVRQAQYNVCRHMRNVQLVLSVDYSMIGDIHPVMKKEIGERLFDAVSGRYKLPECVGYDLNGAYVRLRFNCGPLTWKERRPLGMGGKNLSDEELWEVIQKTNLCETVNLDEYFSSVQCFELAGRDDIFYPAKAKVENGNEVVIFCEKVTGPKKVRYAWRDFAVVDLFTEDGYPVMPFQMKLDVVPMP